MDRQNMRLPSELITNFQYSIFENKYRACFTIYASILIIFIGFWSLVSGAVASHCGSSDYDCQIAEIQAEIDALTPANEQNKEELANTNKQVVSIKSRIAGIKNDLTLLAADIKTREEDLAFAGEVFNQKADNHYRLMRLYDPLTSFLSAEDASEAFMQINIRARTIDDNRKTMEEYVDDLISLKEDKETLEKSQTDLAALQNSLAGRAEFLEGEIEKVEGYLAELSAKQQEVLAAKAGAFTASVGDSELADDYYASIKGFREAAPGGSFAVFSFGAHTHRKGMSQYGARGRAENGQNASQILSAYYGKAPVAKDTGGSILVNGAPLDFEGHYLYGIAEMPSSWHAEALKAQAIAARTYAYRYKIEGKSICTTEACQVYRADKAANPPAAWKAAVDATRGQVLEDVVTFYSSTSGGYLTTMGWDTVDGAGGSNFVDRAWEAKGGSPWLYKAWYRKGYSASGDSCGRSNPWLNREEMADIVNAALVLKNRNDERISPITTACWGGNPYSLAELRDAASPYGGIGSVSSIYATQAEGHTSQVVVNGSLNFSGEEFKKAFNLRAPGYMAIPQSGFAFFNIESK